MNKNSIFAVATLVGAIVGLGMFGIPYTASKAGFFIGIAYILILGFVTLLLHLMYGEIVERDKEKHRLTGCIEEYFGKTWKKISGAVIILSIYAALLAYIIVGGEFLALLFSGSLSPFAFGIIFWLVLSIGVMVGIRMISEIELLMTGLMVSFVFALFIWGSGSINTSNFSVFDVSGFFLPYGVVLFALSGVFAIPEIRELLKINGPRYKQAIIWGSFIPIVIYILFTVSVVGISGSETSKEALQGLVPYLGAGFMRFGAIFGIFAIATSYLVLGINLKHTLEYDWRVSRRVSAVLVAIVPIIFFISGIQQFIEIISFSGAVFGAIIAIAIVLIYRKAIRFGPRKPGYTLNIPNYLQWGLLGLFALGGVYEIIYLIM